MSVEVDAGAGVDGEGAADGAAAAIARKLALPGSDGADAPLRTLKAPVPDGKASRALNGGRPDGAGALWMKEPVLL